MSHPPDQLAVPDILTAEGDQHHLYVTETQMGEVVDKTIKTTTMIGFSITDFSNVNKENSIAGQ